MPRSRKGSAPRKGGQRRRGGKWRGSGGTWLHGELGVGTLLEGVGGSPRLEPRCLQNCPPLARAPRGGERQRPRVRPAERASGTQFPPWLLRPPLCPATPAGSREREKLDHPPPPPQIGPDFLESWGEALGGGERGEGGGQRGQKRVWGLRLGVQLALDGAAEPWSPRPPPRERACISGEQEGVGCSKQMLTCRACRAGGRGACGVLQRSGLEEGGRGGI